MEVLPWGFLEGLPVYQLPSCRCRWGVWGAASCAMCIPCATNALLRCRPWCVSECPWLLSAAVHWHCGMLHCEPRATRRGSSVAGAATAARGSEGGGAAARARPMRRGRKCAWPARTPPRPAPRPLIGRTSTVHQSTTAVVGVSWWVRTRSHHICGNAEGMRGVHTAVRHTSASCLKKEASLGEQARN